MTLEALEQYLLPTYYINSDSKTVIQLADSIGKGLSDESDKAKAIFYWVRDKILYDVHSFSPDRSQYKASEVIKNGWGFRPVFIFQIYAIIRLPKNCWQKWGRTFFISTATLSFT
ncbi:MAG: transglutaminase domain-containing protein [Deltaproteobacteria bacterium]|nr:transglutaminase domain-containing protein [Deltaproteobacteria bacterium]